MSYLIIFSISIVAYLIYVLAQNRLDQKKEYNEKKALLEFYNRQILDIVVESLTPEDNQEYRRASDIEEWLLMSENPNKVVVHVVPYQIDDNMDNFDESWEEYQARLSAFKQMVEKNKLLKIKEANWEGFLMRVKGKDLPPQYKLRNSSEVLQK